MNEKEVIQLPICEVAPGMVTAKDVYSRTDQLIINKGTVLGADLIAKLMFYSVGTISVYSDSVKEAEEDAYTDTLRKSQDFREFKESYDGITEDIREQFENLVLGKEGAAPEELSQKIDAMMEASRSNVHIFNMLHCIRDYDDLMFMHSINVALICSVFANWLRLTQEEKQLLVLAGLLHDTGKLLVPPRILNKAGKLTEEEYSIAQMHALSGYELLKKLDVDERVRLVAKYHHERYDGTGYPENKSGDEIDMYCTLVGIADVFDAMTSKRIYRGAICPFDVISIFEEEGMHLFNPQYLLPLLSKMAETYIHHTVRLSSGERGEIVMINPFSLSRPVVRVGSSFIDLTRKTELKIAEVL